MSDLNVYFRTVSLTTNQGKINLELTQAGLYKVELYSFVWRSRSYATGKEPLPTLQILQLPSQPDDIIVPFRNFYQVIRYEYSRHIYLQGILDYNILTPDDNFNLVEYKFQDETHNFGSGVENVQQMLTLIFKLTKIE